MRKQSPAPTRARWLLLLLAFLALTLSAPAGPDPAAPNLWEPEVQHLLPPPATPPTTLRLVTFNVHSAADLPRLVESIRGNPQLRSADVFFLQEMESYPPEGTSRAQKLAQALRLNYAYAPARPTEDGGTHGLAILSRFPLSDVEVLPLKQYNLAFNTRRRIALAATLDVAGHPLRVYNVHLDTRLNAGQRIEQLRPVVEAARRQAVPTVVIGGDFNTNPFRWLFHVVPFFRSNQPGALDEWMKENGFAAPVARSGSTSRRFLLRMRLDSFYARGLPVKAFAVEEDTEASDHLPVWMEVAWPPNAATNP